MKQYLIIWNGYFPGFKTFTKMNELKGFEKEMIKNKTAILFKVVNGEIKEISLNGKIK